MKRFETSHLKLSLLYSVWWEGITSGGYFSNQVLEQLKMIKKSDPEIQVYLLIGGPFFKAWLRDALLDMRLARYFIRNPVKNRVDITQMKKDLAGAGIKLITRESILFPNLHLRFLSLCLFPVWHLVFLKSLIRTYRIDVLHCRSYSATLVALLTKKIFGLKQKVLFDTRGLVPEEGVMLGVFTEKGLSYRAWKWVERWMLDSADAIVNVSDTFSEHISKITSNPNIFTIFTSVRTSAFRNDEKETESLHERLTSDRGRVLVYLGSLHKERWHSVENLAKIYKVFRDIFQPSKLLIVSETDHSYIEATLKEYGIRPEEFIIVKSENVQQTATFLRLAHFAALPFKRISTPQEALIGFTMMASKTGEYLAAGLPIICHDQVGGAKRVITEHGLGCVYSEAEDPEALKIKVREIDENYALVRGKCIQFSYSFDTLANAHKYARVYDIMLARESKS